MDRNSPVTEVILEALARLLAKAEPEEHDNWMDARKALEERVDYLGGGVKPYATHQDPEDHRKEILEVLEEVELQIFRIRRTLQNSGIEEKAAPRSSQGDDGDS